MKRSGFAPRTAPLARHTSLPRRAAPLAKQSTAARQQAGAQRRAYGAAPKLDYCEACGVTGQPLEHSHLLTQKQWPQHRNNPLGWLMKCRECHRLYEDNKRRFAAYFPAAWLLILLRIEAYAPEAIEQFRQKNPY